MYSDLLDCRGNEEFQEITPVIIEPYPKPTQVDMVEYTKALERTMLKELGKLPS